MDAFYIIATASLFAISCSILGSFLILRKMAMVGDAISHAVLPGIVVAFLFTGTRDSIEMIIGAGILGVFTTFLIEFFHRKARLQADAAIGVTFTWLFALGVILVSLYTGQIDIDQECVLYGEIAYVPLDVWITDSGYDLGPRALYIAAGILIINLLFMWLGYRHLYLTSFDPQFAATIGVGVSIWNYLLMGSVSMTTVAAFESVGAILIVALTVAPAATAYLLTTRLERMIGLSILFSILISILGYYLAVWLDASIAGGIVSIAGLLFFSVMLAQRVWKRKSQSEQVLLEPESTF
jgi:manganese/zinc/iron transport system permease protein